MGNEFVIFVLLVLAIPYVYFISLAATAAYFRSKLAYHRLIFNELGAKQNGKAN